MAAKTRISEPKTIASKKAPTKSATRSAAGWLRAARNVDCMMTANAGTYRHAVEEVAILLRLGSCRASSAGGSMRTANARVEFLPGTCRRCSSSSARAPACSSARPRRRSWCCAAPRPAPAWRTSTGAKVAPACPYSARPKRRWRVTSSTCAATRVGEAAPRRGAGATADAERGVETRASADARLCGRRP